MYSVLSGSWFLSKEINRFLQRIQIDYVLSSVPSGKLNSRNSCIEVAGRACPWLLFIQRNSHEEVSALSTVTVDG